MAAVLTRLMVLAMVTVLTQLRGKVLWVDMALAAVLRALTCANDGNGANREARITAHITVVMGVCASW